MTCKTSIDLPLGFTLPQAQMVTNNKDTLHRGSSKVNKYEAIHTLAPRSGIVPWIRAHELESMAPADSHLAMTVAESWHNSGLASVTIQPLQVLICVTDYPIIIDTSGSLSACHFELVSCRQTDSMNWLTQACGEFMLSGSHSTKPNSSFHQVFHCLMNTRGVTRYREIK